MTKEQRHKWYADSLRNKYNTLLKKKGVLTDEDYENMIKDVEACTNKHDDCRSALFDVLEEFQQQYERNKRRT